jgi:outer membrane protein insertion porin family
VETAKILHEIATRSSQPYEAALIREDIRTIYSMGFFDDVLVEFDDEERVTFVVLERPALRGWSMEDNRALKMDDLAEEVTLKRADILRREDVQKGAQKIRSLLRDKGYYLAQVEPELVAVGEGKNQVDLIYNVELGQEVLVRRIHLPGASEEQRAELKDMMPMSERSAWSWITSSGTFKEAELSQTLDLIHFYYLERGHVDIEIGEPLVQVAADLTEIEITVPVAPGTAYTIGEVDFQGDSPFTREKLLETAKVETGVLFNINNVRESMISLEDLHADEGYAFARVVPRHVPTGEGDQLKLVFAIERGEPYRIGRIEINGNTKTRDRVIRRDIRLAEGDLYSRAQLRKSEQKLNRLGFFETLDMKTRKRPEGDVVDIDINVVEQSTGQFSVGAGYSSADYFFTMASVNNSNLFGYGYQLDASVSLGSTKQSYNLSFNNPRLNDSNVFMGFDVYRTFSEYNEYDKESVGAGARLGTTFAEDWHARIAYGYDFTELKDVCTAARYSAGLCLSPASTTVEEQDWTTTTSSVTPSLIFDSRNRTIMPSAGAYSNASIKVAGGPFGGSVDYVKYTLDSRKYFPLLWDTSFMVRGRGGLITPFWGNSIPVYDRYALGGINTIRGLDWRSVGPVDEDALVGDVEVVGGNKYALFTAEYLFWLLEEAKVQGLFFYDGGNAWDTGDRFFSESLRQSVGGGIRWYSPMGPLRLEYGKVLNRKSGEQSGQWEFSIGGYF